MITIVVCLFSGFVIGAVAMFGILYWCVSR